MTLTRTCDGDVIVGTGTLCARVTVVCGETYASVIDFGSLLVAIAADCAQMEENRWFKETV